MSEPVLRGIDEAELHAWFEAMGLTFGFDPDPAFSEEIAEWYDISRARVAEVDGRFVATFSAFDLDVTVPGGAAVPMSGVTQVTTAATHRRRGILRAFMETHFDEVTDRGWSLAGLWASEATIYGRYGFGPATWHHDLEITGPTETMVSDGGASFEFVTKDEALDRLPPIHDAVVADRPGMYRRPPGWWRGRTLRDRPEFRDGYSAHRIVVASGDGGYVIYRVKGDLEMTLHVSELIARDPHTEAALWSYVLGVDLVSVVRAPRRPVDDARLWQFTDLRAATRTVGDALWLRILDVPGALTVRRYRTPGTIVLDVMDDRAGGRYLLDAGPDGSSCVRTDAAGDVTLPVSVLASLYLGGTSAYELARAGLIDGSDDAIGRLDTLLRWPVAPWCPEIF